MGNLQFYDYEASFSKYKKDILEVSQTNNYGDSVFSKFMLILAIVDGIDDEVFEINRFKLNDWLEQRYEMLSGQFTSHSITPINIPFWHLETDGFWHLHFIGVQEPKSFAASKEWLKENTSYASLDDDLWILLQKKAMRKKICECIVERLFEKEEESSVNKSDSYLDEDIDTLQESSSEFNTNEVNNQLDNQETTEISDVPLPATDTFKIMNSGRWCSIINADNKIVYSSSGKIVKVSGFILRVNYAWSGVKITIIEKHNNGDYLAGKRILSAKYITPFFKALDPESYIEQIEEIRPSKNNPEDFEIKVSGVWFDHTGNTIEALNNRSFVLYCERIDNIKQAKISGEVILAKPVLLLSLIDGVNEGVFRNNRFVLNRWLEKHYKSLMGKYTKNSIFHNITPINNPFWHLQSDGFWHLHYIGAQPTVINTPSVQWLEKSVNYASFDDDLWTLINDEVSRNKLRNYIIENKLNDKEKVSVTKLASYNDVSSSAKESTIEVSSNNEAKGRQIEEPSTSQDEQHYKISDYQIENQDNKSIILGPEGTVLFESDGKLTLIEGVFFRISYTYSSISINIIERDRHDAFLLGTKILKASCYSPLFKSLNPQEYIGQFQDVRFDYFKKVYYFKVDNKWYDNSGYRAAFNKFEKVNTTRVDNKVKPLSSEHGQGLKIIDFGIQSIAVIGDTKPHRKALKAMGGGYISLTVWGPAWIFNKKERERIQAFIDGNGVF